MPDFYFLFVRDDFEITSCALYIVLQNSTKNMQHEKWYENGGPLECHVHRLISDILHFASDFMGIFHFYSTCIPKCKKCLIGYVRYYNALYRISCLVPFRHMSSPRISWQAAHHLRTRAQRSAWDRKLFLYVPGTAFVLSVCVLFSNWKNIPIK